MSMANTNERMLTDLVRRARQTEAERDAERYEEIEALGNLATWSELREQHDIARRSAIRRHREIVSRAERDTKHLVFGRSDHL
jgi:hypothetical protein